MTGVQTCALPISHTHRHTVRHTHTDTHCETTRVMMRVMMKSSLTGSVLRPAQPTTLRVVLDTDDVNGVSLFHPQICPPPFAVHPGLGPVDDLHWTGHLTPRHATQTHVITLRPIEATPRRDEATRVPSESKLTLNFFLASCSFFSRSFCHLFFPYSFCIYSCPLFNIFHYLQLLGFCVPRPPKQNRTSSSQIS